MTTKWLNMGLFKKDGTCIIAFFTPFYSTLPHFVNFTLPFPLCCSLNFTKKLQNERKEYFFAYIASSTSHVISTEVEHHIFKHDWIFRHYVFINNPHWQSSEIIILLCKYYIVISDKLAGSFLDVLFLLLAGILSELHEKPRRKDCVTEKCTQKNLDITFLTARPPFYVFLLLSLTTLSSFPSDVLVEQPL